MSGPVESSDGRAREGEPRPVRASTRPTAPTTLTPDTMASVAATVGFGVRIAVGLGLAGGALDAGGSVDGLAVEAGLAVARRVEPGVRLGSAGVAVTVGVGARRDRRRSASGPASRSVRSSAGR